MNVYICPDIRLLQSPPFANSYRCSCNWQTMRKDKSRESRKCARDFDLAYSSDPGTDANGLSNVAVRKFFTCPIVRHRGKNQRCLWSCHVHVLCWAAHRFRLLLYALAFPSVLLTTANLWQPRNCTTPVIWRNAKFLFLLCFSLVSCRWDPCTHQNVQFDGDSCGHDWQPNFEAALSRWLGLSWTGVAVCWRTKPWNRSHLHKFPQAPVKECLVSTTMAGTGRCPALDTASFVTPEAFPAPFADFEAQESSHLGAYNTCQGRGAGGNASCDSTRGTGYPSGSKRVSESPSSRENGHSRRCGR